ncbi:MAG: hypothetical protein IH959_07200 [Chloroflexi bacterium]|nr:hypothetical protein [Chloroflexota bacterium]
MKGLKGTRFGVLGAGAIAVAVIVGLLVVAQVSAATGGVSIGDGTAAPGADATVDLTADGVTDPGLGAWTVDITYDSSVVSVTDCSPQQGGVCNPAFADEMIRVTGASAGGLDGDTVLANITFECGDAEGSSDLTLTVNVFADATIGDPQDIDATISNGSITCEEPAPEPTATTDVGGIGGVGTGLGSSDGSGLAWLVAALAAVGAVALGFGAVRMASRRS